MNRQDLIKKGFSKYQADAILSGNCIDLAREIAYSTGTIEDMNYYFNLKRLSHDIRDRQFETYNEEDEINFDL